MTYRFKLNETVSAGASRIGTEQIDMAQSRLTSRDDLAAAIHDARRCLKRTRALLRLVRPALPDSTYRREATRIAGIGKLLAEARDRYVMQQTLAKLESRFDTLPKTIAIKLNKLLANGSGTAGASAQQRRQALKALEQARTFFVRLERRAISFEHIADGVERSYKRARRTFREAFDAPSGEAFHEWRKTVQQHWRHMQLVSRAWPDVLGARADEAKELSRLLGDEHDIHILLAFAESRGIAVLHGDELAALMTAGKLAQDELRALAKPRGARLLAEPAGDLRERIVLYWSAAQDLSEQTPSKDAEKEKTSAKTQGRARKVQAASRARAGR